MGYLLVFVRLLDVKKERIGSCGLTHTNWAFKKLAWVRVSTEMRTKYLLAMINWLDKGNKSVNDIG